MIASRAKAVVTVAASRAGQISWMVGAFHFVGKFVFLMSDKLQFVGVLANCLFEKTCDKLKFVGLCLILRIFVFSNFIPDAMVMSFLQED